MSVNWKILALIGLYRLRVPVDYNTYFSPPCLTLEKGGSNVKGEYNHLLPSTSLEQ